MHPADCGSCECKTTLAWVPVVQQQSPKVVEELLLLRLSGFGTNVLPTSITSVDPRVPASRILGDFPSFRLLGFRVNFRRSAVSSRFLDSSVPSIQLLGSPMVSRYWKSSIILELFILYELWSACSAFEFPRQRNNRHHSNLHTDNLRSNNLYTSTTSLWLLFCWCLVARRQR